MQFQSLREPYCDFYLLLEYTDVAPLPAPHRELLERSAFGEPLRQLDQALAKALASHEDATDDLCEAASPAETHSALVNAVGPLLYNMPPDALRRLLVTSAALRTKVVAWDDRRGAEELFLAAQRSWTSPRTAALVDRVWNFFRPPVEAAPLDIVAYPLATACPFSFGSLTNGLLTLGIHPASEPEGVVSILVHELVHVWLEAVADDLPEGARTDLEEPLATAIGNGWIVHRLSGSAPPSAWYDEERIDGLARRVYHVVARALDDGTDLRACSAELLQTIRNR